MSEQGRFIDKDWMATYMQECPVGPSDNVTKRLAVANQLTTDPDEYPPIFGAYSRALELIMPERGDTAADLAVSVASRAEIGDFVRTALGQQANQPGQVAKWAKLVLHDIRDINNLDSWVKEEVVRQKTKDTSPPSPYNDELDVLINVLCSDQAEETPVGPMEEIPLFSKSQSWRGRLGRLGGKILKKYGISGRKRPPGIGFGI